MGSSPQSRSLFARHSTISEVVQFEVNQGWVSGLLQSVQDTPLDLSGLRGYGSGVPHLEQQGLQIVRQPVEFGVGVLYCHEGVAHTNRRAFVHGLDADG